MILDEVPFASAIAVDADGRGVGMLAYLLRITTAKDSDLKELDIAVRLNVPWETDDDGSNMKLEGFNALAVALEYPGHERIQLEVYEGAYPCWQALIDSAKRARTDAVGLSAWTAGRVAKAAKVHGDAALIRFYFGGKDKPVAVHFGSEPEVSGLVMPVLWDIATNSPWGDRNPTTEGDDE